MLASCQTVKWGADPVAEAVSVEENIRPAVNLALFDTPPEAPSAVQIDAYYIPFELKNRLLATDFWSSVRMNPVGSYTSEFFLWGEVEKDDPHHLRLAIALYDASGRPWLEKSYRANADRTHDQLDSMNPFHALFDQIVMDVNRAVLPSWNAQKYQELRDISELRYAGKLSPEMFEDYLDVDEQGITRLQRLPDRGNSMFERIRKIRQSEEGFIESMDSYYSEALGDIGGTYLQWRNLAARESHRQKKYERRSWMDGYLMLAGELATAGAMFIESFEPEVTKRKEASISDKGYKVAEKWSRGFGEKATELQGRLERSALLASVEMRPYVAEVEGTTRRLTGTAADQYTQWRAMLKKIYAQEIGL